MSYNIHQRIRPTILKVGIKAHGCLGTSDDDHLQALVIVYGSFSRIIAHL